MEVIDENAEHVTLKLNPMELVGFSNSIWIALKFHSYDMHSLTGMHVEEAKQLQSELRGPIDRMRERRLETGLPW
jgi:hypothetical protein